MWEVWSRYDAKGELSRPFNPVCLFYNKTCTWKRGRDCYWYVRKEPQHEWVDIWNYGKTYVFNISVLFIVDTTSVLKLFFPLSYWFCHDGQLKGCVVVIINVVVAFFFSNCNLYTCLCRRDYHRSYCFCFACLSLLLLPLHYSCCSFLMQTL